MKRNPLRRNRALETDAGTAAADGTVTESPSEEASRRVARRRALLTGGAVVVGAVGAGAAMAASAEPANAATGDPVNVGDTATATTNATSTEIVATSDANANPTLVLTNTGSPAAGEASPPLRITPAASGLVNTASSTAAGDITATNDGNLWFTHNNPGSTPIPATVHTDLTSNSFVPLTAPNRVLDTRSAGGRANILDPSGNLDSSGRLLGGHTIHINLSHLVIYGYAVTGNLTVIEPVNNGWVLIWPGIGSRPTAASIAFSKGVAISNLTVSGISHQYSNSVTDSVAVTAADTTHVILDVGGFYVANFGQVIKDNPFAVSAGQTAVRASQVRTATGQ